MDQQDLQVTQERAHHCLPKSEDSQKKTLSQVISSLTGAVVCDRLPVQDHHQPLCPRLRWPAPAAPLPAPLHHLHPVCLLRQRRGQAVRRRPPAPSPQPQLLGFHRPTGALSAVSASDLACVSNTREHAAWAWCLLCRSCCRSVRATGSVSCPSTTCCLGGTPVPALPNTSMWTTNASQVSPDTVYHTSHRVPTHRCRRNTEEPYPYACPPDPCHSFRLSRGLFRLSLPSAEHKRLVVCEGGEMILRCKPPRVLNIYAAVYGRSPDHTNTCPSHLRRPPPFGEWLAARGQALCPIKMSNNNNIIRSEGTGTVASTIL